MLYPDIEPNSTHTLPVSGGHTLYFELSGNPEGIPVIFIHGGPGGALPKGYQRFFDPNLYFVIGFDQRGCGRSVPFGSTENNTTTDLLHDIAALKQHLNIDKWVVFGGSWGATMALLTAIDDPASTLAVVLRGTFLARQFDFDWFISPNGGAAQLFPDYYEHFVEPIGKQANTHDVCVAFYKQLKDTNEIRRANAIRAWYQWEERLSRLTLPANYSAAQHTPLKEMTSMALLECHYILNRCFIDEGYILNNIDKIAAIPGIIVHGRYDAICSTAGAFALHKQWPNSQLNIIPNAGHSTAEPGIASALVQATRQVAKFLKHTV
ncbi:prolyl aminopeptidase [Alteromonas sediminis]|uniref:Proline iminopeptidase n=1 Tax=Alteromonas sediminis TaxID=2259342 RepID=A0A3N5XWN9_9ALTE|nr:prolyl aminopeptidase [Alteromonas sediminis]RPJ64820.1 prolyl aminopeptidase [Alteromonas sediminis]